MEDEEDLSMSMNNRFGYDISNGKKVTEKKQILKACYLLSIAGKPYSFIKSASNQVIFHTDFRLGLLCLMQILMSELY